MLASRLDTAAVDRVFPSNPKLVRAAPGASDRTQRAVDLLLACGLLVIAAPLIGLAWVLVRLTSAGPGFYSQSRVGRHGEPFTLLKLRTMYHNCEAESGPRWSTDEDERVTPVGRFLRQAKIDELPQLFNVLRGDMSLVGPRPERPEFVRPLSRLIPNYSERLRARPGLTGLAQVQLPPDRGLDSVRRKLILDLHYIDCRGPWLDLRLLAATGFYLAGFAFPTIRRILWLPNPLATTAGNQALIDTDIDSKAA